MSKKKGRCHFTEIQAEILAQMNSNESEPFFQCIRINSAIRDTGNRRKRARHVNVGGVSILPDKKR